MNFCRWMAPPTQARSYEAWKHAAMARDEASGKARWRLKDQTRLYDYVTVRARLEELRQLLAENQDRGLLVALDDGVHGNLAGMGRPELYSRAESGTKKLIGDYIDAVCEGLQRLAVCSEDVISAVEKRQFFDRANACFGRSALLLSGGGMYGNFHIGVVKVLIEHDLLPNVISGSSAGALIAALVGTHKRTELARAFDEQHLAVAAGREASILGQGFKGLLPRFEMHQVTQHIERLVPDLTFAEAYERSGIRINLSVSPTQLHQSPRLLNALTTPHVLVRSAVIASCSVPGVFPPAMLVARSSGGEPRPYMPERRWYDGSVTEDVPTRRLSRLYGVNHSIVSQVNPFALALARPADERVGLVAPLLQFWQQSGLGVARAWQLLASRQSRRWPQLAVAVNGMMSVLSQNYSGDINILPDIGMVKIWRGMKSPTKKELRELIAAGERATWPKVEMIRNCTRIGRVLDEIGAQMAGAAAAVGNRPSVKSRRTKRADLGTTASVH